LGTYQDSSFNLDDSIVSASFNGLANETRWPEDAADNFCIKRKSVGGD
jgi:hypothetical protein